MLSQLVVTYSKLRSCLWFLTWDRQTTSWHKFANFTNLLRQNLNYVTSNNFRRKPIPLFSSFVGVFNLYLLFCGTQIRWIIEFLESPLELVIIEIVIIQVWIAAANMRLVWTMYDPKSGLSFQDLIIIPVLSPQRILYTHRWTVIKN